MPSILKRFMKPPAVDYVLLPAEELTVGEDKKGKFPSPPKEAAPTGGGLPQEEESGPPAPKNALDYAEIQAEAILEDARRDAEQYKRKVWADFQLELTEAKNAARQEGYRMGYAEGMAKAQADGREELNRKAEEQIKEVESFLEAAARARDRLLDESREDLKELALAIAEKVIRVSLKGSADILRRMVEAATDKKKRCEWTHVYIAGCDAKGSANTIPELTAALRGVSNRVRVVTMADDESGTCIIEMPDEILDASVSTQLGNIRETLMASSLDED